MMVDLPRDVFCHVLRNVGNSQTCDMLRYVSTEVRRDLLFQNPMPATVTVNLRIINKWRENQDGLPLVRDMDLRRRSEACSDTIHFDKIGVICSGRRKPTMLSDFLQFCHDRSLLSGFSTFKFKHCGIGWQDDYCMSFPNVKIVELSHCRFNVDDISKFFNCFPNMEQLILMNALQGSFSDTLDFLGDVKPHLRVLKIRLGYVAADSFDVFPSVRPNSPNFHLVPNLCMLNAPWVYRHPVPEHVSVMLNM